MSVTVFFMVNFINLFFVELPPPSVSPPPPTQEQQGSLSLYLSLSLPLPLPLPLLLTTIPPLSYTHCYSILHPFHSCPLPNLSFSDLPTSLHACMPN